MAKWQEDPHPNALTARMSPTAIALNKDKSAALLRRKQIYEMHQAGVPTKEIALRFGISAGRAWQLITIEKNSLTPR